MLLKFNYRFIFPCAIVAGIAFSYQLSTTNSIIFAVPGLLPNHQELLLFHYINPGIMFCFTVSIIMLYDSIFLSVGFYFIAVLNIFSDMILCMDNSNLGNRKEFLKMCYLLHCEILVKFELFSNVFYMILIAQTSSSTVYILVLFYLLLVTKTFSLFPVVLLVLLQFAALCAFGEFIFTKTEKLRFDLYLTKWYEFNLNDKKFLLMMMIASLKPFGFKSAGIYDINSIMFIQIMKMGFSFGTILYTFTY